MKTPVSAGYYVELLSIVPLESLAALSRFLVTLLQLELEDIPRGLVSSATKRSQVHSSLEKGVMGIENMLKGMCLAYQEKDSVYGLVAGRCIYIHCTMLCMGKPYVADFPSFVQYTYHVLRVVSYTISQL